MRVEIVLQPEQLPIPELFGPAPCRRLAADGGRRARLRLLEQDQKASLAAALGAGSGPNLDIDLAHLMVTRLTAIPSLRTLAPLLRAF